MTRFKPIVIYIPITAFLVLFAVLPVLQVLIHSFYNHSFTIKYYTESMTGQYMNAFITTFRLSFFSALLGVLWGAIVTFSLVRSKWPWLQAATSALSGVLANFAGLSLAVAFMVTFGASGLITNGLASVFHINLQQLGFNLASESGLLLVYSAFQTPLAIILLIPAFSGISDDWENAAYTLGAGTFKYLQKVLIPLMWPSLLGTFALLFSNSFSAYVTAYALSGGSINLVPIQIGYLLNGNVSLNIGLGNALAVEEMIILALSLWLFNLATRRGKRHFSHVKGES